MGAPMAGGRGETPLSALPSQPLASQPLARQPLHSHRSFPTPAAAPAAPSPGKVVAGAKPGVSLERRGAGNADGNV